MNNVYQIRKSVLFMRHLHFFAHHYLHDVNAGKSVALRFLDKVEEATRFIKSKPFACAVYMDSKQDLKLAGLEYRKWQVKGFPHSIFFKVDGDVITIAGLYAQKMHIAVRFPSDMGR